MFRATCISSISIFWRCMSRCMLVWLCMLALRSVLLSHPPLKGSLCRREVHG